MFATWQHHRHGQAHYRMRVTNLPAPYAEHAPASFHQLQNLIAETYWVQTYRVQMAKDWMN